MRIIKWNVELRRLKLDDIEFVRQKRNDPKIRNKMFYTKEISPQEQLQWFNSINNSRNFYFIIHVIQQNNIEKIGLINGKNINYEEGTAEGGLFIWDDKYWKTPYPIIASIILHDLAFLIIGLKKIFIKIRKDNPEALIYNKMLGFKVAKENTNSITLYIDKNLHLQSTAVIRKNPPLNSQFLSIEDIYFDDSDFLEMYKTMFLELPLNVLAIYAKRIIQTVK